MRSLRFRLFAAFFAVILLALVLVGLALLVLLRDSPLVERGATTRLNEVARALSQRAEPPGHTPAEMTAFVQRVAQTHELRVVLLDPAGRPVADSAADSPDLRLLLRTAQVNPQVPGTRLGRGRDANGDTWSFLANPLADGRTLVLALPQPRYPLLTFFVEDLLAPLLQAGVVAALAALGLAVWISRSIARPLQRMAVVAQGVARGDYSQAAPAQGPDEVRALGQALNSMTAQIQATQQTQQDFLGNISHELKTPLTSIQGFAQAIREGAADSPAAVERAARIIFDEAERMRRLVEELLELTRLDAGLRALRREPVDLRLLLETVAEKFQPRAAEKAVTLAVEAPAGLPGLLGDADRLAQVFTNLLDNALKHTPAGGRVALAATATTAGLEVAVTDTGAGIPAEDLGRVFERFYQVDKSRARPGGVGLGLAITREIVQAHRGTITVESVLGLGTRFVVRLPRAWPEDATLAGRRR